jgi:hypothetical protein
VVDHHYNKPCPEPVSTLFMYFSKIQSSIFLPSRPSNYCLRTFIRAGLTNKLSKLQLRASQYEGPQKNAFRDFVC